MDSDKKKLCTKCGKEFFATNEFFYRDIKAGDGLRSWCKDCTKKAVSNSSASKYQRKSKRAEKIKRPAHKEPLTTASPEAIIAALRKGMAREIINIIEEKFGNA